MNTLEVDYKDVKVGKRYFIHANKPSFGGLKDIIIGVISDISDGGNYFRIGNDITAALSEYRFYKVNDNFRLEWNMEASDDSQEPVAIMYCDPSKVATLNLVTHNVVANYNRSDYTSFSNLKRKYYFVCELCPSDVHKHTNIRAIVIKDNYDDAFTVLKALVDTNNCFSRYQILEFENTDVMSLDWQIWPTNRINSKIVKLKNT